MTYCHKEEIPDLKGKYRTLIKFTLKTKYPISVVP